MDAIPLVIDGFLAGPPTRNSAEDSACWRLCCSSGTDHLAEEAVLPCTTLDTDIAHQVLHQQPGDLLRVTGTLTLPGTSDGILQLRVDTLDVLWEAPLLDTEEDSADSPAAAERDRALHALGETLTHFERLNPPGPGQSVRLHLSATTLQAGPDHSRSITLTPGLAQRLADSLDAVASHFPAHQDPTSARTMPDPQTVAELTDFLDGLDLYALTGSVLAETRTEHRAQVIQAMDDMFPSAPASDDDPEGPDDTPEGTP
jgi:hypothetical protein